LKIKYCSQKSSLEPFTLLSTHTFSDTHNVVSQAFACDVLCSISHFNHINEFESEIFFSTNFPLLVPVYFYIWKILNRYFTCSLLFLTKYCIVLVYTQKQSEIDDVFVIRYEIVSLKFVFIRASYIWVIKISFHPS